MSSIEILTSLSFYIFVNLLTDQDLQLLIAICITCSALFLLPGHYPAHIPANFSACTITYKIPSSKPPHFKDSEIRICGPLMSISTIFDNIHTASAFLLYIFFLTNFFLKIAQEERFFMFSTHIVFGFYPLSDCIVKRHFQSKILSMHLFIYLKYIERLHAAPCLNL